MDNRNTYTVIGDLDNPKDCLALEAVGDYIIVHEDRFRTGYECKVCDGYCYIDEECPNCKGIGLEKGMGLDGEEITYPCRVCCPSNIEIKMPGKKVCPECNGKGGLLVAAQTSESRPTSGVIMSVGPDVKYLSVGDRILYNLFSGTAITFKNRHLTIRLMHEIETVSKIYGLATIGDKVR